MITEIAEIDVVAGQEEAFEAAVGTAAELFRKARGCHKLRLERSIEQPQRYRLFVTWDSVADHMVHFRDSPAFARWRELVSPYFDGPPRVEHTHIVFDGF